MIMGLFRRLALKRSTVISWLSCIVSFALIVAISISLVLPASASNAYNDNFFLPVCSSISSDGWEVIRLGQTDNSFRLRKTRADADEVVTFKWVNSVFAPAPSTFECRALADSVFWESLSLDFGTTNTYAAIGVNRVNGVVNFRFSIPAVYSAFYRISLSLPYQDPVGTSYYISFVSGVFNFQDSVSCKFSLYSNESGDEIRQPLLLSSYDSVSKGLSSGSSLYLDSFYFRYKSLTPYVDIKNDVYMDPAIKKQTDNMYGAYVVFVPEYDLADISAEYYYLSFSLAISNCSIASICVSDGVNTFPYSVSMFGSTDILTRDLGQAAYEVTGTGYATTADSAGFNYGNNNNTSPAGMTYNYEQKKVQIPQLMWDELSTQVAIDQLTSLSLVVRVPRAYRPNIYLTLYPSTQATVDAIYMVSSFALSQFTPANSFEPWFYALIDELKTNNDKLLSYFQSSFKDIDASNNLETSLETAAASRDEVENVEKSHVASFGENWAKAKTYFKPDASYAKSGLNFVGMIFQGVWDAMGSWTVVFVVPMAASLVFFILGRGFRPPKEPK